MGFGVDERAFAPEARGKWGISLESAEEVMDRILWPSEDRSGDEISAIYDDAESDITLRELNDKHNLGIPEEIILESEGK